MLPPLIQALRDMVSPRSMLGEGDPHQSMPWEKEPQESIISAKSNPEIMHMERDCCLAITQESIHDLGVRIHNFHPGRSLLPIGKHI